MEKVLKKENEYFHSVALWMQCRMKRRFGFGPFQGEVDYYIELQYIIEEMRNDLDRASNSRDERT